MRGTLHSLALLGLGLLAAGCVDQTVKSTTVPSVQTLEQELPEGQLMDVGIVIFDPGLDGEEDEEFLTCGTARPPSGALPDTAPQREIRFSFRTVTPEVAGSSPVGPVSSTNHLRLHFGGAVCFGVAACDVAPLT